MLIDQFAGLRNDVATERFEPNDLAVASNVILDDSLRIERRPGITQLASGAKHSLWSNGARAFFVEGGTLFELAADMTSVVMRSGLTGNAPMSYATCYATCDERIYFANGFEYGVIDGGEARSWGAVVPSLPVATPTTGSLDAGTYQYTLTSLMADGQESGALPPATVEVTDGGIDFVMPALGDDVQAHVLYVSSANGETLYEAQIVTGNSTTLTTHNDVVPIDTLNLCPPLDNTHIVAEYFGHMLIGAGVFLMHSQTYGPELFDHRDYLVFDGALTMIAATDNGVYVGTENSISYLAGRSPEEMIATQLTDYGVIAGSQVMVQSRLLGFEGVGESMAALWLTNKGICVGFPGGAFYNLSDPRYQLNGSGSRAAALLHKINGSTYYTASI